ncbi:hypothetical protein LV779_06905 [Streptomyces thinghirensis]|nr:hypothetical protein [Streptomyces thinghirensis]
MPPARAISTAVLLSTATPLSRPLTACAPTARWTAAGPVTAAARRPAHRTRTASGSRP